MVELGAEALDFELIGIDDQMHSLEDYKDAKVLVIVFMCNHCPYVQAIWDDLVLLANAVSDEVQFLGVNSNANPDYPDDSFENMKVFAEEKGQEFPYLFDEDQSVALAYDAQCTPDIFMYDASRKLAYRGAFEGLECAIEALLAGEEAPKNQVHSMGCSIKWL